MHNTCYVSNPAAFLKSKPKKYNMRFIFLLLAAFLILEGCKTTSKGYLERSDADKALQDAIKRLSKNPDDEKALEAVPVVYRNISEHRLAKIKAIKNSKDITRWQKLLEEYQQLENAYQSIVNSAEAFRLVNATSYGTEILETKEFAATDYYKTGNEFVDKPGRENARKAYYAFKQAEEFSPGFKDATEKMNLTFKNATLHIVINPIEDNSFFNSSWGNFGYNYSNEFFQQNLVRELGGGAYNYPAKFYTDWEARRNNVTPDWIVYLRLRNIDIPFPFTNTFTQNRSAQIKVGSDTAGKPVYNTVNATVNITRMNFTARAEMEVTIKDLQQDKNINYRTFRDDYRWEQETGSYTGDRRALTSRDWQAINNNYINTPRKEEILNELFRRIYPQVRNNISSSVEW